MIPTLSAADYTDPARWRSERMGIFRGSWLALAHTSEVPTGHALARTVAGWPLLLVRDAQGTLRAFFNVCAHRAAPLLDEGTEGPCPTLRCRYHGWTYAPDGALRSAVDFGAEVDAARLGLRSVHVDTWRGVVFVHIDPPARPLAEALSAFAASAGAVDLGGWVLHRRATHTLRCNWKVYVENYLEGYHIPWVHPGLHQEVDVRRYAVEAHEDHAVHRVPMRAGGATSYEGFWAWLWPNVAFNLYQGGGSLERITPVGPAETRVEYLYLFAPGTPEALRDQGVESSRAVTVEDVAICEAVQRNLESGVYTAGVLSPKHEQGVARFAERVRRSTGGATP